MVNYKRVNACRVCGHTDLLEYLNLGELPLANGLLDFPRENVDRYPLAVLLCRKCFLSQLSIVVDPEILYSNYAYRSSVSRTFKQHCFNMAQTLLAMHHAKWGNSFSSPQPTLIDIGANDGCLVNQFKRHGFSIRMAVEPDPTFKKYYDKDVPFVGKAWNRGNLEPFRRHLNISKSHFITATNVFAHVEDVNEFILTAKEYLTYYGALVIEVPHAYHMITDNEFDTIYHEHLSYMLLTPLIQLFQSNGMRIFRVEKFEIHGGTMRIYADCGEREVDDSVESTLRMETVSGMTDPQTYIDWGVRIAKLRQELRDAIPDGIVAYGASAKGCTLLNYCDIRPCAIFDDTPAKQGKFVPGVNAPIIAYDFHAMMKQEKVLLLAWNFKDEIIQKNQAAGYKGKWIIPIPSVEVV